MDTQREKKLKPCPFCGGKPRIIRIGHTKVHYIECAECRAKTKQAESKDSAIEAWNRRA